MEKLNYQFKKNILEIIFVCLTIYIYWYMEIQSRKLTICGGHWA